MHQHFEKMMFKKFIIFCLLVLTGCFTSVFGRVSQELVTEGSQAAAHFTTTTSHFLSMPIPIQHNEKGLLELAEKSEEDDDETKEFEFSCLVLSLLFDEEFDSFSKLSFKSHLKPFISYKSLMIGYSVFRL